MGSKGRTRRSSRPMSEINVTPFVDVMLVLLIVFMVTAPLLTVGVPVNLPKTKAPALTESVEPLVVSINKDGVIYLMETDIPLEQLPLKLKAVLDEKPDTKIMVRGDRELPYGEIMRVMGALAESGLKNVSLVALRPQGE